MTLSDIRGMLKPGETWTAVRRPGIGGALETRSVRVIRQVRSKDYICTNNGNEGRFYGTLPARKRDVLEARDGFLRFNMSDGIVIELTRSDENREDSGRKA